ncbi:hypothetical protein MTR67_042976 [Solanum verrucosum]|uniref:Ubiquitin-like protease family profile domain-containing protein n=1 Tax=Solanum verrucosum TaxID=315347 RepID=A0AAF0ZS97_SOLVR|nr:hypothetical protein MTR67_042976 [Solanum verrucosum]
MHVVVPWFTVDNIFIPVNVKERLHWVLIVVPFNERCIHWYMIHSEMPFTFHTYSLR